jgi:vancomycin permeability regulator SanA
MLRLSLLMALLLALLALPRWFLALYYQNRIAVPEANASELPRTAIVFGAGLRRDGMPTTVLADRVKTAVELHQQDLVSMIIMSGTRNEDGYDEPASMKALAVALGVPESAILEDRGGTRTIETCRRAHLEFGLDSATLVSQRYHLPRALAMCESLDISAVGIAADRRTYRSNSYWTLREYPATLAWLWESIMKPNASENHAAVPMMENPGGPTVGD